MGLKIEIAELSDGRKVSVKELSFAAQMRIATALEDDKEEEKRANQNNLPSNFPHKFNWDTIFLESLLPEDFKILEEISRDDGLKIQATIQKLRKENDAPKNP